MDTERNTLDLEKEHLEERVRRVIEDPLNPVLLAQLIEEGTTGRSKFHSSTLRWLRRLLKRSVGNSLKGSYRGTPEELENRREKYRECHRRNKSSPEGMWKYLKERFEWNVRTGVTKSGRFLLTVEELRWLFWELEVDDPRFGRKGERITLRELEKSCVLRRIDTSKDYELGNLKAVYRFKRRVTKKKGKQWKRTFKRHTVLWDASEYFGEN